MYLFCFKIFNSHISVSIYLPLSNSPVSINALNSEPQTFARSHYRKATAISKTTSGILRCDVIQLAHTHKKVTGPRQLRHDRHNSQRSKVKFQKKMSRNVTPCFHLFLILASTISFLFILILLPLQLSSSHSTSHVSLKFVSPYSYFLLLLTSAGRAGRI
jgi:hypothetical protein